MDLIGCGKVDPVSLVIGLFIYSWLMIRVNLLITMNILQLLRNDVLIKVKLTFEPRRTEIRSMRLEWRSGTEYILSEA